MACVGGFVCVVWRAGGISDLRLVVEGVLLVRVRRAVSPRRFDRWYSDAHREATSN